MPSAQAGRIRSVSAGGEVPASVRVPRPPATRHVPPRRRRARPGSPLIDLKSSAATIQMTGTPLRVTSNSLMRGDGLLSERREVLPCIGKRHRRHVQNCSLFSANQDRPVGCGGLNGKGHLFGWPLPGLHPAASGTIARITTRFASRPRCWCQAARLQHLPPRLRGRLQGIKVSPGRPERPRPRRALRGRLSHRLCLRGSRHCGGLVRDLGLGGLGGFLVN